MTMNSYESCIVKVHIIKIKASLGPVEWLLVKN